MINANGIIVTSIFCSNNEIMLYYTSNDTMKHYMFAAGIDINDIYLDNTHQILRFYGSNLGLYTYEARIDINHLDYLPDIADSALAKSILTTTYTISIGSFSLDPTATYSASPTTSTIGTTSITMQSSLFFASDAYYYLDDLTLDTYVGGNTVTYTPIVTCSYSGSTTINYEISDYLIYTAPTWVAIDSSSAELTLILPNDPVATTYMFSIVSVVDGNDYQFTRIVTIVVNPCLATN